MFCFATDPLVHFKLLSLTPSPLCNHHLLPQSFYRPSDLSLHSPCGATLIYFPFQEDELVFLEVCHCHNHSDLRMHFHGLASLLLLSQSSVDS